MKCYLLLFFSTMFLLFSLQKSNSLAGAADIKQGIVSQGCKYSKQRLKKPCAKKCLTHQLHPKQKGNTTTITDCSQQVYAIVATQQQHTFYSTAIVTGTIVPGINNHLSPYLETEHAPPRLS